MLTKVTNFAGNNGNRFVEVPTKQAAADELSATERRKALADWCHGLSRGDFSGVEKRWGQRFKAQNAEASGGQGGYLVPTELSVGVDAILAEENFFRKRCPWLPMTSATMNVPSADPAQGAAGVSPILGGFTMYWTPEATAPTNSNPAFQMITLTARNLCGVGYCSRQLFDDGGEELGAYLELIFGKAAAFFTQLAFFNGNGVQAPLGVINGPSTTAVTRNTANQFQDADAQSMSDNLLPASWPHAWWCVSPTAGARIAGMSGFQPNVLIEDMGSGFLGNLYGRPVYCTEVLPALGTKGDVNLIDPRMYVVGCRKELEVAWATDSTTAWTTYQTAFRVWVRCDGQPLWRTAATISDGSTSMSPYVTLNT